MKRNLLCCGIVAGPLFIVTSLIQAFTRTGFDLARHPISLLGLGSLGWVQITNFVVSGVLYVLGAVGLRSALQSGRAQALGPVVHRHHWYRTDRRRPLHHRPRRRLPTRCSGRRASDELARACCTRLVSC